jgi:hypothetical protein
MTYENSQQIALAFYIARLRILMKESQLYSTKLNFTAKYKNNAIISGYFFGTVIQTFMLLRQRTSSVEAFHIYPSIFEDLISKTTKGIKKFVSTPSTPPPPQKKIIFIIFLVIFFSLQKVVMAANSPLP